MRDATAKALGANLANRSDVALVRQGLYAGPLPSRPSYPGPTGTQAVQCSNVPTVTPSPAQPVQQAYQWYVLEAVISFTTNAEAIGIKTENWGSKKVDCTVTDWTARQLLPSELPEALRIAGEQLAQPRGGGRPGGARVVSTRVYQGPSATKPKLPASWGKQECGKPY